MREVVARCGRELRGGHDGMVCANGEVREAVEKASRVVVAANCGRHDNFHGDG